MMEQIKIRFASILAEKGIILSEEQLNQFELYYDELIQWNEKVNLTAITDTEQVFFKHFYDSLTLGFFIDLNQISTLADIGSGAGFPSVPVKIAFPHLRITIIDSLNKRISFLRHLVDQMGLQNVTCIHSRAEDAARNGDFRDIYDLVTARAVARLNVLNELCLPFVKSGGIFAAMKGASSKEEVAEAEYSASELKAKFISDSSFHLPDGSQRHIVIYKKEKTTPRNYPRKTGVPNKNPLVTPNTY